MPPLQSPLMEQTGGAIRSSFDYFDGQTESNNEKAGSGTRIDPMSLPRIAGS